MSNHLIWEQATQWLSRTLAVVLLMILPGMAGGWLDRQLSTNFLMPLGFALGVVGGVTLLVILGRLFTPPAGGRPLPEEEPEANLQEPGQADEPRSPT